MVAVLGWSRGGRHLRVVAMPRRNIHPAPRHGNLLAQPLQLVLALHLLEHHLARVRRALRLASSALPQSDALLARLRHVEHHVDAKVLKVVAEAKARQDGQAAALRSLAPQPAAVEKKKKLVIDTQKVSAARGVNATSKGDGMCGG